MSSIPYRGLESRGRVDEKEERASRVDKEGSSAKDSLGLIP